MKHQSVSETLVDTQERKVTRNNLYLLENYGKTHRENISGQDSLREHSTNVRVSLLQPRGSEMMGNGFLMI